MTMRSAVASPDDAVESADSDEENDNKPPKILRFNGDKISLHKTNGNGNGRRAASGGASQIARPPARTANPDQKIWQRKNIPKVPNPDRSTHPPPLTRPVPFSPNAVYELDVDADDERAVSSAADDDNPSNLAGLIDEVAVVEDAAGRGEC